MSTDKKSHWASLASVIGAKVPPEPAAPPTPAPKPEPVAAAPEVAAPVQPVAAAPIAPTPAKPLAKPKARDNWGKVLGALGLRAPEPEPEPEPEQPAPEPVAVAAPILPPAASLPKNLWELLGDKPPESVVVDRIETEVFVGEVGGNDLVLGEDEEGEDVEDVGKWKSPAADSLRSSIPTDRPRRRDEEAGGERPRRRRRRRRRTGEAGVESTEARPSRGDFEPVEDRLADDRQHLDESHDDDFSPVVDDYDRELDIDADVDVDTDDVPVARKPDDTTGERPRRRRRRRRGRGRSSESAAEPTSSVEPPARSPAYAEDDDDVEDDGDYEPAPPPRREPARSAAPRSAAPPRARRPERTERPEGPAERVDDLLDDEEDDDAIDHGEHRSIPTWQDAIGLVVGANMEARAKNPGGNRSGSRGRGGRGRGGRR